MFLNRLRQLGWIPLLFATAHLAPAQDAVCTLADHIRSANTNTAVGFCPTGTGHDIITITEDITLSEPLPPIRGTITIEGGGHTISGDDKFPVFVVVSGRLTINNLTLTKGYDKPSAASNWYSGGALRITGGEVAVNHSLFLENSNDGHGGAIGASRSKLTVNNSSFVNNQAYGDGGAISISRSTGEISNSSFVGNRTRKAQAGGAISVDQNATVDIVNSTFYDNYAGYGGAVATQITRPYSTVASRTTLTHVTMVDNRSSGDKGRNIWVDENDVNFKLRNSIIVGSGSCLGPLRENIGNFIEDGSCASMAGGDPMLAEMTGAPAYFPLLDGSPAYGRADPTFCLPTDQLGNPRPHCDIGAVESARDPNFVAVPAAGLPDDCTLADQIHAANMDEPAGACPAGDGADVIRLRQNITLGAPLPTISSDITIDGYGHSISGDSQFRLFDIESGNVVIKHITLVDGRNPDGYGGAVTLRGRAELLVVDATFRNNQARMGGALASIDASHLYVFESSFFDNEASSKGGALWRDGSCGYFNDIIFRRNTAGDLPGGVMDDYLTHIDGGASTCTADAEVYTLSDS